MGTSRDPSVRVSSSDQFGSTPGGICVKFSTSHILLWHVLRLKVWYQSNQSGFIVSTDACRLFFLVTLGRNQPLKKERPPWTSEMPLTEGQLRSKRDEFWETAPAFEGRKEIWDALRAAAETDDHTLAQAIVDGANITLPTGKLKFMLEFTLC